MANSGTSSVTLPVCVSVCVIYPEMPLIFIKLEISATGVPNDLSY